MSPLRRLAALLLVVGVGYFVIDLWRRSPRDVQVNFRWGDARHGLRSAEIYYLRDGAEVRRVTFHYGSEAPYQQPHATHLVRGPFDVRVRLETGSGSREVRRVIEVGGEDEITLLGPW